MRFFAAVLLLVAPTLLAAQNVNDAGISVTSTGGLLGEATRGSEMGSGSFDGTEPTMSPRFFRAGVVDDPCDEFAAGDFQFQTVDFLTDGSGTLDVSFDPQDCDTGIYVTFHEASFNPADICQGYVWAFGSSAAFTESFVVPADTEMQMVISGVNPAPDVICGPFTYEIQGTVDPAPPVPALAVPAMGPFGLALLGLMLGLLGLLVVRQKVAG